MANRIAGLSFVVFVSTMLVAPRLSVAEDTWKTHAMWCVSDAVGSTGQVVERILVHSEAKKRYCDACRSGKDQFDSLHACYANGDAESAAARKQIDDAGRDDVNRFLVGKAPDCCKRPTD